MDLAWILVGSGMAFFGSRLSGGEGDTPTWGAILLAIGVVFAIAFTPAFVDRFNQGYQDGR